MKRKAFEQKVLVLIDVKLAHCLAVVAWFIVKLMHH